jgi:hypothetical protein
LGIGAHTARDDQSVESGGFECTSSLDRQDLDNGFDECAGDVGATLLAGALLAYRQ